jgi:DNA-directed RNA polymerase subunit H
MDKFHILNPSTQMPMIDSQDMMAKWIGAKPGDIVEIMRKSETAGSTPYYRHCVADVTL